MNIDNPPHPDPEPKDLHAAPSSPPDINNPHALSLSMPPDNLLPSIAHIQHTTDTAATQANCNSSSCITVSETTISPSSDTNFQEYDEDRFSEQPQHQQQQQQLSQQELLHVDQWRLLRDERFSTFDRAEMRVKELARQQGFNVFRLRSEQSAVMPRGNDSSLTTLSDI